MDEFGKQPIDPRLIEISKGSGKFNNLIASLRQGTYFLEPSYKSMEEYGVDLPENAVRLREMGSRIIDIMESVGLLIPDATMLHDVQNINFEMHPDQAAKYSEGDIDTLVESLRKTKEIYLALKKDGYSDEEIGIAGVLNE